MEAVAVALIAAASPILTFWLRARHVENLCREAERTGAAVKIKGNSPLTVDVEYVSGKSKAVE